MLGRKYANGTTTDVVFATSDLGATSVAEALPAAGNGYLALHAPARPASRSAARATGRAGSRARPTAG